jgi:PucR family transcriptional regulator, purine catabolism regulatory protein
VPQLYRDAGHAIEIANRISCFGRVVSYRDLGIYRLLLQIGDERRLTSFAESILGPVIRYDATHKLALIDTLSVFLNQRESLKQAARRLHVHANTVTYRLQRIEQLIPLRLSDPDDRLLAHVAVKILELQQGRATDHAGDSRHGK